jgi:ribose transport system substrate-binding protein
MNKAGKVMFVGFDSTEPFLTALRNSQMHGFVVQSPYKMGYLGVRTMTEHLLGKAVEKRVDTGVVMITPENIDSAEVKELIKPPVK